MACLPRSSLGDPLRGLLELLRPLRFTPPLAGKLHTRPSYVGERASISASLVDIGWRFPFLAL